jgi:hypothetical protein
MGPAFTKVDVVEFKQGSGDQGSYHVIPDDKEQIIVQTTSNEIKIGGIYIISREK